MLVKPGQRALYDPALPTETGAVPTALGPHERSDPPLAQLPVQRLGAVGAVTEQRAGPASRSARLTAHVWNGFDQGEQLADVVTVGGGGQAGKRDPAGVGDQVVLGAGFAPIDRAGTGFRAPKTAGA
jgi:hypothetical protein